MKATERVVQFALTPTGMALDRVCVRWLGHSPVSWLFARADGSAYNRPLLLHTRGRRTGAPRRAVLPWFPAGGGRLAIVGSRGGMPADPNWAHNLRAVSQAAIHLDRRIHPVRVQEAEGAERESLWKSISERAPVYLEYQRRAQEHRLIPIFVLESSDGSALDPGA